MLYNLIRGSHKALRLRFLRKAPKNWTLCAIIVDAMHWNSYLRTTVQSSLLHIHSQMNSRQDYMLHRSCMGLDGIHFLVKCKKKSAFEQNKNQGKLLRCIFQLTVACFAVSMKRFFTHTVSQDAICMRTAVFTTII